MIPLNLLDSATPSGGSDRAQLPPQQPRQRYPDEHKIAVAVVIGIKNATSGGAGAQMRQGLRMRTGEKNHQRRQTLVYPDGEKMAMVSGIHDSIP